MSWKEIREKMLPPMEGVIPHDTSAFGTRRKKGSSPHVGIDSNYHVGPNGQTGFNLTHPELYSPVSGVVTNAGQGTVGRIAIRDADGFSHELLHTHSRNVKVGDRVVAGQVVGTMGNTRVLKPGVEDGDHHLHYQLKDPAGNVVNPSAFWDLPSPFAPDRAPVPYLAEQQYLRSPGDNPTNAAPINGARGPFATGGRFAPGPAITSQPPNDSGSLVPALSGTPQPDANKDVRRPVRVPARTDPNGGPSAMSIVTSADRPSSFDERFGDWTSSADVSAPRGPYQPGSPGTNRSLGIFSGEPMPDWPFPPPIWDFPNQEAVTGSEEWTALKRKRADWNKAGR